MRLVVYRRWRWRCWQCQSSSEIQHIIAFNFAGGFHLSLCPQNWRQDREGRASTFGLLSVWLGDKWSKFVEKVVEKVSILETNKFYWEPRQANLGVNISKGKMTPQLSLLWCRTFCQLRCQRTSKYRAVNDSGWCTDDDRARTNHNNADDLPTYISATATAKTQP